MRFREDDLERVRGVVGALAAVEADEISRLDAGDFFQILIGGRSGIEIRADYSRLMRMRVFTVGHGSRDVLGNTQYNERFSVLENAARRAVELLNGDK